VGDLWEKGLVVCAAGPVGWVTARRLLEWSRGRCAEALAAACLLPEPPRRAFALRAASEAGALSRAQARDLRAFQQALDDEWRDGVLLARRAVPAVPPSEGDPAA